MGIQIKASAKFNLLQIQIRPSLVYCTVYVVYNLNSHAWPMGCTNYYDVYSSSREAVPFLVNTLQNYVKSIFSLTTVDSMKESCRQEEEDGPLLSSTYFLALVGRPHEKGVYEQQCVPLSVFKILATIENKHCTNGFYLPLWTILGNSSLESCLLCHMLINKTTAHYGRTKTSILGFEWRIK